VCVCVCAHAGVLRREAGATERPVWIFEWQKKPTRLSRPPRSRSHTHTSQQGWRSAKAKVKSKALTSARLVDGEKTLEVFFFIKKQIYISVWRSSWMTLKQNEQRKRRIYCSIFTGHWPTEHIQHFSKYKSDFCCAKQWELNKMSIKHCSEKHVATFITSANLNRSSVYFICFISFKKSK